METVKIIFSAFLCICTGHENGPIANTKYGMVEGKQLGLHNGNTVNSFLGIPYAAPPVGELRWQVGWYSKYLFLLPFEFDKFK